VNKNHKYSPEPGRLIKCKGFDWCTFECFGMFKAYQSKKKRPIFCIRKPDGTFETDRETWKDVESWGYVE
jgi:hypothetical protein